MRSFGHFLVAFAACARRVAGQESHETLERVEDLWKAAPAEIFSTASVATHDSADDCWVILYGLVYDFTEFQSKHPGGANEITPHCGKDATTEYSGVRNHNVKRLRVTLLLPYLVGRQEGANGSQIEQAESADEQEDDNSDRAFSPPTEEENVLTARWLTQQASWGTLSTVGMHWYDSKDDSALHAVVVPFASSRALEGRIFFYLMGEHRKDNSQVSLTISQASLNPEVFDTAGCGTVESAVDPQDPRCAKLTLTGHLHPCSTVEDDNSDRHCNIIGREALFGAHPTMQDFPENHNFMVHELHIHTLWMIAGFGGGSNISPHAYANATGTTPHKILSGSRVPRNGFPSGTVPAHDDYPVRARWIVHNALWTSISTIDSDEPLATFGNIRSVVDGISLETSTGLPVFNLPNTDPTAVDIANGDGSIVLTFSEAALAARVDPGTGQTCGGIDAGIPTCAQVTLMGQAVVVEQDDQLGLVLRAFAKRHPLAPWLSTGGSHMESRYYTIQLERISILDYFGGAVDVQVADYLHYEFGESSPYSFTGFDTNADSPTFGFGYNNYLVTSLALLLGATLGFLVCFSHSKGSSSSKTALYGPVKPEMEEVGFTDSDRSDKGLA